MKNLITILSLLIITSVSAQKLDMRVSYARFFPPDAAPVFETYFAIDGNSLDLQMDEDSILSGGVEVTMIFKQEEEIKGADRFRIHIPAGSTHESVKDYFTHTQQLSLPAGNYALSLSIKDIFNPEEQYDFTIEIALLPPVKSSFSDVKILQSYSKADENTANRLAGMEMIPLIPQGDYYIPGEMDKFSFYAEFYNLPDTSGQQAFLIKYYIEKASENGAPLNAFAGIKRLKGEDVFPLLTTFDVKELRSGSYNLVLEAVDQNNEVIERRSIFFYRANPNKEKYLSVDKLEEMELENNFVDAHVNLDSINEYVDYLWPIGNYQERRTIETLVKLDDKEKLKRFFNAFWVKKEPLEPYEKWLTYHKEVKMVNKKYGTQVMPGYQSDRGRVYLQYGPPTLVEDRRFETGTYPYEIWQYDQLESPITRAQVDRIFIFVDREVNTNRYRLVHSNAQGEQYNEFWMRELQGSFNRGEVYETEEMQNARRMGDGRGDWGSRAGDNLIINPSTMGRYGRW